MKKNIAYKKKRVYLFYRKHIEKLCIHIFSILCLRIALTSTYFAQIWENIELSKLGIRTVWTHFTEIHSRNVLEPLAMWFLLSNVIDILNWHVALSLCEPFRFLITFIFKKSQTPKYYSLEMFCFQISLFFLPWTQDVIWYIDLLNVLRTLKNLK